ncbi:hypothetical protein VXO87_17085 [Acinetobacter baumannii]|nr:hypothetical protein [Acinetobacter baumannii]MCZ3045188.1 hypothetical protein [Acinetobacter baumannii]MDV4340306.1 hypothetical protein [Acinetobacter baumannii]
MAALAISGGSLVACQLQPAFQTKEAPTLFTPKRGRNNEKIPRY